MNSKPGRSLVVSLSSLTNYIFQADSVTTNPTQETHEQEEPTLAPINQAHSVTTNPANPEQVRVWYDRLTHRLAALDKDISRALSEYERAIHRERWQEVAADRELLVRYQEAIEADQ